MLEDVGPGTHRLAQLAAGDELWLIGPLGRRASANRPTGDARILAGGGVGVPPLRRWAGSSTTATERRALLGFRDAHHAAGAALWSMARRSPPTTARSAITASSPTCSPPSSTRTTAVVYACGPPGMLEAVRGLCAARDVPAQLALEAGMACGFGACYGCVVPLAEGGYVRLCVDGPVLDAERLDHVPGVHA